MFYLIVNMCILIIVHIVVNVDIGIVIFRQSSHSDVLTLTLFSFRHASYSAHPYHVPSLF